MFPAYKAVVNIPVVSIISLCTAISESYNCATLSAKRLTVNLGVNENILNQKHRLCVNRYHYIRLEDNSALILLTIYQIANQKLSKPSPHNSVPILLFKYVTKLLI